MDLQQGRRSFSLDGRIYSKTLYNKLLGGLSYRKGLIWEFFLICLVLSKKCDVVGASLVNTLSIVSR